MKIGRMRQSIWGYCHASLCICVSVGVSGRWMDIKGTCGIFAFISLFITNLLGGSQHDTIGLLGG